jgi:hypothetical protein
MSILFVLLACFGVSSTPCDNYCNYICDCHAGEPEYDCEECFTTYDGADATLQDECETSLIDLQNQDDAEGRVCGGDGDTGGGGQL